MASSHSIRSLRCGVSVLMCSISIVFLPMFSRQFATTKILKYLLLYAIYEVLATLFCAFFALVGVVRRCTERFFVRLILFLFMYDGISPTLTQNHIEI